MSTTVSRPGVVKVRPPIVAIANALVVAIERLEAENAELHAEVLRLARENDEQYDVIAELRAMNERARAEIGVDE